MPLKEGSSKAIIQENIKEMIAAGHDPKQAMAAAYANARKSNVTDEEENPVVSFVVYTDDEKILCFLQPFFETPLSL